MSFVELMVVTRVIQRQNQVTSNRIHGMVCGSVLVVLLLFRHNYGIVVIPRVTPP